MATLEHPKGGASPSTPLYDILREIIAAWTAGDLERVLTFMDEEIVWHYAAPALPPVRGRAAARRLLQRFTGDMHDIAWRIFHHAETQDRLFVEGVDEYVSGEGRRIAAPYAGVLDFRNGLIVGWRDYVDLAVMAEQKAGTAPLPHVEALLARSIS